MKNKHTDSSGLEHVECNLCGSVNEKTLYHINGLSIVRCLHCNLVYVNPRPRVQDLFDVYTENYFENVAYREEDEKNYFGYNEYIKDEANILKKFQKKIGIIEDFARKKGRLLDIGCACGFFMNLAQSRGWEVEGTEVSMFAADYVQKRFGLRVHTTGNLEEVCYQDKHFDAVTMWDVIEHLPDPKRTLGEVNRIMKKGGVLGIITPDIGSLVARVLGGNWLEVKRVKEHIYFFSRGTLEKMLQDQGFEIVHTDTSGKHIKFKTIIKELNFMNLPGMNLFSRWIEQSGWSEKTLYLDPLYKIAAYAIKRKDVDGNT